ncbi:DNA repair protein RAD54 [Capsaspora owczarzaki ATCC 30864]|uniref:DNA repair protein RAD54 n=2 Tax=Capsaspora owczarzaki (strain ATCC 30864) TaxID=595528 RepID=A0A0D2WRP3_CAPO3|nr:DNA repair protein RAD54 [Capsaspora owczarzaki ATCC 30864]
MLAPAIASQVAPVAKPPLATASQLPSTTNLGAMRISKPFVPVGLKGGSNASQTNAPGFIPRQLGSRPRQPILTVMAATMMGTTVDELHKAHAQALRQQQQVQAASSVSKEQRSSTKRRAPVSTDEQSISDSENEDSEAENDADERPSRAKRQLKRARLDSDHDSGRDSESNACSDSDADSSSQRSSCASSSQQDRDSGIVVTASKGAASAARVPFTPRSANHQFLASDCNAGGMLSTLATMTVSMEAASQALADHESRIGSILTKPFKVPLANGENYIPARGLGMRKPLVRCALHSPDDEGALVLFAPEKTSALPLDPKTKEVHVVVDPMLTKVLRLHQREGVKFLYDAVMGDIVEGYQGCIMADEMGLGKTLQCVSLIWTLLRQGRNGMPTIEKAVIICPASLVKNWHNELQKWLQGKVQSLPVDGGDKEKIESNLNNFINCTGRLLNQPILIISYETFRIHVDILASKPVGLVICDEGHRLKNAQSQTFQALNQLKTDRRVLLSGTPIQNDLTEYFSLLLFTNPGLLGTQAEFRRRFENPILRGREASATDKEKEIGTEKLQELAKIVNKFIIRRTNSLLSKYLPTKVDQVVCIKLSPLQTQLYEALIKSKAVKKLIASSASDGQTAASLGSITLLKKLCNHPDLIYEACQENFRELLPLFPPEYGVKNKRGRTFNPAHSGKFQVLDTMLAYVKSTTNDRVVLISNYTQTIDLFEDLARLRGYRFVRLDGTLSVKARQKLVDEFNNPSSNVFLFLLSSKAGGCGINLIGGNRLVLFDPDWNPASDGQAMARVWRDGQKKKVYLYRFLGTGTIEEKIFQRQAHKMALSSCVVDEEENVERHFTSENLRDLFTLNNTTSSDTHDRFNCEPCKLGTSRRAMFIRAQMLAEQRAQAAAAAAASAGATKKSKQKRLKAKSRGLSDLREQEDEGENRYDGGENDSNHGDEDDEDDDDEDDDASDSNAANAGPESQVPDEMRHDISRWNHFSNADQLDDTILKNSSNGYISFTFHCQFGV